MTVYEKLITVQAELKVPKSQYNAFGKYNYRNAEDILESVKPILDKYNSVTILTDEIKLVGERYYVEATARFIDCESGEEISVKASAREEETKKGMDGSQVTGASSSYARKYALNGLFAIDDTKDSDTTNNCGKDGKTAEQKSDKPFLRTTEKPMTLEEAKNKKFTSRGVEYTVGDLDDDKLEIMAKYTKMPEIEEACRIVLENMNHG